MGSWRLNHHFYIFKGFGDRDLSTSRDPPSSLAVAVSLVVVTFILVAACFWLLIDSGPRDFELAS